MKKLFLILMAGSLLSACNTEDQGSSRHSGANADKDPKLLQSPNNTDRVESGSTTHSGDVSPDSVRTPATDKQENRPNNQ